MYFISERSPNTCLAQGKAQENAVKTAANIKLLGDIAGHRHDSIQGADDSESSPEKSKPTDEKKGLDNGEIAVASSERKDPAEGELGRSGIGKQFSCNGGSGCRKSR